MVLGLATGCTAGGDQARGVDGEPAPGSLVLVHDGRLVFATAADEAWGVGAIQSDPAFDDQLDGIRAIRAVNPRALGPDLRAALEGEYVVYGPDAIVCTTSLGPPWLSAEFQGSDGFDTRYDTWGGLGPSPSPDAVELRISSTRGEVWNGESHWLVARFDDDCEGGLWARRTSLAPPTVLTESSGETPESARAFEALLRSGEAQRARSNYEELDAEDEGLSWREYAHRNHVSTTWFDSDGVVRAVSVVVGESHPCGDFDTRAGLTFSMIEGELRRVAFEPDVPAAVFDADGDGRYEMVFSDEYGVTLVNGDEEREWATLDVNQCAC